jgi:mRNA interferase MazF
MELKRGAIVVVAAKGAYTGKPRPALVVQSDLFNPTHPSVTVCPITSDSVDAPLFRLPLPPGDRTGLRTASQVMIDKVVTVPRASIDAEIGRCDETELGAVDGALRRWMELD